MTTAVEAASIALAVDDLLRELLAQKAATAPTLSPATDLVGEFIGRGGERLRPARAHVGGAGMWTSLHHHEPMGLAGLGCPCRGWLSHQSRPDKKESSLPSVRVAGAGSQCLIAVGLPMVSFTPTPESVTLPVFVTTNVEMTV